MFSIHFEIFFTFDTAINYKINKINRVENNTEKSFSLLGLECAELINTMNIENISSELMYAATFTSTANG